MEIAQHINAGNAKAGIAAHGIAHRLGLAGQGGFTHNVAGEAEAMMDAPITDLAAIGGHKQIGYKVLEAPSDSRKLAAGQLPKKLGNVCKKVLSIYLMIKLR